MSKLLEHLQVRNTDERKHVIKPLKMVTGTLKSEEYYHQEYSTVYSVRAVLGSQVIVSNIEMQRVDVDFILKQRVYRPLAEEIFGEFRRPLIDADFAIAQGEYETASKLIREVLDSMFKV